MRKMVDARLILDIRYFESGIPNIDGASLPDSVGTIFHFPRSCQSYGVRIARKLREMGFQCGSFDHLYINFTTAVPENTIAFSPRLVHKEDSWLRYVDFGLSPSGFHELPESRKMSVLIDSTFEVLRFVASGRPEMLERIREVSRLIDLHGHQLEILHKKKETDRYSVSVLYRVHNPVPSSTVLLEFHDKATGETRKGPFLELSQYEDIFFLISDLSLKKGRIILKPRSSFKADIYNKRYKVPIIVPLEGLGASQNGKIEGPA